MPIRVLSVVPGSPAGKAGIRPEEWLVSVNGEAVIDEIDYQALTAAAHLKLVLRDGDGRERELSVKKGAWDPLGLCLDETVTLRPRPCRNHCLFCFIDQMPRGMRKTLYVKDDDWRLSLMMGNYVTLTNVDDAEFDRILRRNASPLFISVHATDPEVRTRMLRNPGAAKLMPRLRKLRDRGLKFHAQIVLCPGINDGGVLDRTIRELAELRPATQSVAIVPVGVTCFREGLAELRRFTRETAAALLDQVIPWQERFLRETGTRLVFPSDEFYCLSGYPLPSDEAYEDYYQIENGVGMLRQLERECLEAEEYLPPVPEKPAARRLLIPTGVSAHPFIEGLARRFAPPGVTVQVLPVVNRFFGETITVTGLLVGRDLIDALRGIPCDEILLSGNMLRQNTDSFLDDVTLEQVREALGVSIRVVENQGESFLRALRGLPEEDEIMEDKNG